MSLRKTGPRTGAAATASSSSDKNETARVVMGGCLDLLGRYVRWAAQGAMLSPAAASPAVARAGRRALLVSIVLAGR